MTQVGTSLFGPMIFLPKLYKNYVVDCSYVLSDDHQHLGRRDSLNIGFEKSKTTASFGFTLKSFMNTPGTESMEPNGR